MSRTIKNAVVIGGGIAGLAISRALSIVGIDSWVFEEAPEIKNLGGGLTIYPYGALALKALNLELPAAEISHPVQNFLLWDNNTLLMEENYLQLEKDAGAPIYSFSRHELQTVLAASIPEKHLRYGFKITKINDYANNAVVSDDHGNKIETDLVIIANGSKSKLFSKFVLGETRDRSYCGYSFWGGFLEGAQKLELPQYAMGTVLGADKTAFFMTLPKDRQWFYLVAKIADPSLLKSGRNLKLAKEIFGGWSESVNQILSLADETFQFGLPVYEVAFKQKWHSGRIVGIGDAVHAIGPTAGQGANAALTDALALAYCLATGLDLASSLRTFDTLRNNFITNLYLIESKSAQSKMNSDPDENKLRNRKYFNRSAIELMSSLIKMSREHQNLYSFFEKRPLVVT